MFRLAGLQKATMNKLAIHILLVTLLASFAIPAEAANCSAIGQQIAASEGGTLVRASPTQNGHACNIVIVVPGKNGQRSRRIEKTVPAQ